MIRRDDFRISRRPYAVNLSSYQITSREPRNHVDIPYHQISVNAVWFRRRNGVVVATLGVLWDYQRDPRPKDVHEALGRHTDGRYGGDWIARWSGTSYASKVPHDAEEIQAHLAILRPMLDLYPEVPAGYDGWWEF